MGSENKPTDEEIKQALSGIIATLHEDDREKIKELFCECYCKFNEEYLSMYKEPDRAFEELDREKCNYCPLNKI